MGLFTQQNLAFPEHGSSLVSQAPTLHVTQVSSSQTSSNNDPCLQEPTFVPLHSSVLLLH